MSAQCSYGGKGWEEHPKCETAPEWAVQFQHARGYYCDEHIDIAQNAFPDAKVGVYKKRPKRGEQ